MPTRNVVLVFANYIIALGKGGNPNALRLFLPIRKSFLLPLGKAILAAATNRGIIVVDDSRHRRCQRLSTAISTVSGTVRHLPSPIVLEIFGGRFGMRVWDDLDNRLGMTARATQLLRAITIILIGTPVRKTVRRIAFVDDPAAVMPAVRYCPGACPA
jgi:hypothetical protein